MVLKKIQGIVSGVLGVALDEVQPDTRFVEDLGADSLDIFQILMGLEEEFEIQIPTEQVDKIRTVGEAVALIQGRLH